VNCGGWPFWGYKHFIALYVFDGALWLQFDERRFDLGKADVHVEIAERRHFGLPMRTFWESVTGKPEVECRYLSVDTYREGWPENNDIRFVIANAARDDSMKRRTMYVWRCPELGKPVDYALLAKIEAGEIDVVPGM